ncbi:metal-dependent hydrolase [Microbacterium faecale]|uniref:Metal-dependent hydrolase n=1 Tax=Microbacterium faecale TaxID=1804630 RepID=A0A917DDR2_9MICO|nr:amidohydrolase family protein [Microbacterium faecale]GGD29946.1 metal-dependent hydrolase [Microbacterium faecale]
MTTPIIDAHQHVWDPARGDYGWLAGEPDSINRAFTLEELLPELRAAGVDRVVQVQSADHVQDTELMLESAARHEEVAAIVAYAPLGRPDDAARIVESWRGNSLMVGVRNLIHNMPDPSWLLRPEVDEGLGILERAGLTFDLVSVLPRHLELVPIISERHPDLRIVIDHLSKPPIGAEEREPWWSLIGAAAENPNVFGKVSGLYPSVGDPAGGTSDLVAPFFDRALELFGSERLMYGGDWPISVVAGGYTRVWQTLQPLFNTLGTRDRERVLGGTAAEFYRIDTSRL